MLWIKEREKNYRVYHCDLCGEEEIHYRLCGRGRWQQEVEWWNDDHRIRDGGIWTDAWKFCSCEKGFPPWHKIPEYARSESKQPHCKLRECDHCGKRGGTKHEGGKLKYFDDGRRKSEILLLCPPCYRQAKHLDECRKGIKELDRLRKMA